MSYFLLPEVYTWKLIWTLKLFQKLRLYTKKSQIPHIYLNCQRFETFCTKILIRLMCCMN
jgi:hypothetical protein